MSHIQLNYAALLFWSIFGKIHGNILFIVKKFIISERSIELLRKCFSKQVWKVANPEENLDWFKQQFFIRQVKGDKY